MKGNRVWVIVLLFLLWPLYVKWIAGAWPIPQRTIDFSGGVRLIWQMDPADSIAKGLTTDALQQQALQSAKDIFLFRLREFESSDLTTKPTGSDRLEVEVPGVKDKEIEHVLDDIGHQQLLTFRILGEDTPDARSGCFQMKGEGGDCVPVGPPVLVQDDFMYEATDVSKEAGSTPSAPDVFVVELKIKKASEDKWNYITRTNTHRRLAICLDNVIELAPEITSADLGLEVEITPFSTRPAAEDIEKMIKSGPLPVKFNLLQEAAFDATVSAASLNQVSRLALLLVAAITVFLFLAYSNRPHLAFLMFTCQLVQISTLYLLAWRGLLTLNLLAVCALAILSAVSVDGLILICEEFIRTQRMETGEKGGYKVAQTAWSLRKALERERGVIIAANCSSVIGILPFYFFEGSVRGLVTTILIGTALAVATSLILAPSLLTSNWIVQGIEALTKPYPALRFHFNLLAMNRVFLGLYLAAVLSAGVLLITKPLIRGIDFAGGTELTIASTPGISTDTLAQKAQEYFGRRSMVRHLTAGFNPSAPQTYVIQVPDLDPLATDSGPSPAGFISALENATSSQIQITGISSVGPAVTGITNASTLQFIAIGIGMLAIFLLYLTGTPQVVASILIALVCDTTITVGAICFFNVSLSLPIVSALLTVAGYSVYDSVVVARHVQKEIPLCINNGTGWKQGFSNCLRYLSRRLILTMTTTALAGLATAIYCEGLLRDFGIVMATGAIFGMMSTVAIVVGAMRFHYRRQ